LLGLIKHAWLASGGVYGYRKVTMDCVNRAKRAAVTASIAS